MNVVATRRVAAVVVAGGGVLFSFGNLLHPLEHNEAAYAAATWAAAHLTFALGGLLVAVGLPVLVAVGDVAKGRLVVAGSLVLAFGSAGLAPGAWYEAYVGPLGHDVARHLEGGAAGAVNGLLGAVWLAGVLLFGVAVARKGSSGRVRLAGAVLVGSVVLLLAGPALPVAEGLWIIPASVAVGLALAAVALGALRAPSPVTVPGSMAVGAVR